MNRKLIIGIIIAVIVAVVATTTIFVTRSANNIDRQLELGYKFLDDGNYEEAIIAFERAIEIDENNIDAYMGLAEVYVEMDEIDDAIDALEEVIAIDDEEEDAYELLVELLIEEGEVEAARTIIEEGLEETDSNVLLDYQEMLAAEENKIEDDMEEDTISIDENTDIDSNIENNDGSDEIIAISPPVVSVESGTYNETIIVFLEAEEGTDIYFTLDGTVPDSTSEMYQSGIEVVDSSVLKVVAINGTSSQVSEYSYIINNYDDTFIIYDSDTRFLSELDISELSLEDIQYARNEIFARHGYIFSTERYQIYFGQFDWYEENPSFSNDMLNEFEEYNAQFLLDYENLVYNQEEYYPYVDITNFNGNTAQVYLSSAYLIDYSNLGYYGLGYIENFDEPLFTQNNIKYSLNQLLERENIQVEIIYEKLEATGISNYPFLHINGYYSVLEFSDECLFTCDDLVASFNGYDKYINYETFQNAFPAYRANIIIINNQIVEAEVAYMP